MCDISVVKGLCGLTDLLPDGRVEGLGLGCYKMSELTLSRGNSEANAKRNFAVIRFRKYKDP